MNAALDRSPLPSGMVFPTTDAQLPDRAAVLLLGPPGSGKTSLSRQLAERHHGRIFRLREYALDRARVDAEVAEAMATRADALGWLPDSIAVGLVRTAVAGPFQPSSEGLVLFEGYPGNAHQAEHVVGLLRRSAVPLVALVLQLDPDIARWRARHRRVCHRCDPVFGESHRPAQVAVGERCADCGGPVLRRSGDAWARLAARTSRFCQHLPAIQHALFSQNVPWLTLDAECPPEAVLTEAEHQLMAHLTKEQP